VTALRRAPELLLGQEAYTEAVDMWAAGCIFGELLRNEPLFPAKAEADMLDLISRLLGAPSDRIWPVRALLPSRPRRHRRLAGCKVPCMRAVDERPWCWREACSAVGALSLEGPTCRRSASCKIPAMLGH